MYGQRQNFDAQAIYDRAKQDIELQLSMKRIEEKLDLILLFIKERNDEDPENDDKALKLITGLLGGAMNKSSAAKSAVPSVSNAGFFNSL